MDQLTMDGAPDVKTDADGLGAMERQWKVGRAPWYTSSGTKKPFIIGVTGGTASGKTTVCKRIVETLGTPWVILLSMDRYYRGLTHEEITNVKKYNFDHPDAFDWPALKSTLADIKAGKSVQAPIYDFKTHGRLPETDTLYGADVVIVEGIFVLYDQQVRDFLDMKVFVDADADLRLARRLKRDICERGRDVDGVLTQYVTTVKPSYDLFIAPTKAWADLIIPRGGDNYVAIQLLVDHVRSQLQKRGTEFYVQSAAAINSSDSDIDVVDPDSAELNELKVVLPPTILVLEQTPSVRALQTLLRDHTVDSEEFRWHANRLSFLTLSRAFDTIPSQDATIQTPAHRVYRGLSWSMPVVGVSVIRAGSALEVALKELIPEVPVGKIVIQQSDIKHEGPRLYYAKLVPAIQQHHVLLMDAVISTGNATQMAVRVLLDHGVPEERITCVTLFSAPQGLHTLSSLFPKMHIVTASVDSGLDGNLFITPGVGSFGDRYFGTEAVGPTTVRSSVSGLRSPLTSPKSHKSMAEPSALPPSVSVPSNGAHKHTHGDADDATDTPSNKKAKVTSRRSARTQSGQTDMEIEPHS